MENEMLNKILEEVKSLRTEMNERFENVDKKFEEIDNKFEGKFEGLNSEVKEIKRELNQLRKDFESHDRGEKMAWEDFEKSIGKEFDELKRIVKRNEIKMDIIGNGLGNIYEKYKIAEEQEKYEYVSTKGEKPL